MCRILILDKTSSNTLTDRTRMYLNLLGLPAEVDVAVDYSGARKHLHSKESYDILMTEVPNSLDSYMLSESACLWQPQIRRIFLSETSDNYPLARENDRTLAMPMSIGTFFDVFSQVSPETVSRANASRKSNRWCGNHDVLLERIMEVLAIIREEYMEDISLNYLAERVYSSPCYLSTLFTKFMGISPMAYVNEVRMKNAVDLLINTDISITDICQMVGYRNLPYFCTCFKNKYNVTPAQFRRQAEYSAS